MYLNAKRIKKAFKEPKVALDQFLKKTSPIYPDKFYIKTLFRLLVGYKLDLNHPKSFNEKLNWLKLYDRNPLYTILADKIEVKKYVAKKVGEQYVVPSYGVWDSPDEVNFNSLPNQFVIKCNHCSGSMVICKDKNSLNEKATREILWKGMKYDYYWICREWVYKDIRHRITADKYLDDGTGNELRDYKFWCFNGVPKYMYCTIKGENVYENFYDMDFVPVDINHGFPRHAPEFEKPNNFELMKQLASKLSEGIPFVRIDFFDVKGKVYFGEFTFYDWAGFYPFSNREMDMKLGTLIELPRT